MRILSFAILTTIAATARGEEWPSWRGPTGMGLSAEKGLPEVWGGKDNRNVLWKSPLYTGGDKPRLDQNQSSPIVKGERVFVTFSYWPEGVVPAKESPEHHVVCFRTTDGQRLWDTKVPPGPWKLTDLRGGYTASTPAADGQRVYVLFGSSVAAALDHDGKIVWRKEITPHSFDVAMGTSPVLYKETVLIAWDQTNKTSRLIALDRKTGDVKWEKKRPTADWAHSTPTLAEIKGKTQLLVAGANTLEGLDPDNGETLWSCTSGDAKPARIGDTVSPVLLGGLVYADSGRGGPGVAVDPTGTGDVTKTHLKWKIAKVPDGSIGSPVVVGEHIFRMQSPELLHCLEIADGKPIFAERLNGASTVASPIVTADGRIFIAGGAGKSYVIKAGPKLDVLGVNDLGDPSHASPALANSRLFLKGGRNLYCVGNK
jgi:outer membrane protein assembly factor BamB